MSSEIIGEYERLFGIDVKDIHCVQRKLKILGIEMKDLIIFLDRDKVQLFAELEAENKFLKMKIEDFKNRINDL